MASNLTNQSRNVKSKKLMANEEETLDNINLYSVITIISFFFLVPCAIFLEGFKFTPSYLKSAAGQGLNVRELCIRSVLAAFCFHVDQKETQDYTSRCAAEANNMAEDIQLADHDVSIMERESAELLKASELKLEETIRQCEEEIQMHGRQLFNVIDSVTKYKEQLGSKVSEIKRELLETVTEVADIYRKAFPEKYSYILEACRQIEKIE